jgi:hypothetical protein
MPSALVLRQVIDELLRKELLGAGNASECQRDKICQ